MPFSFRAIAAVSVAAFVGVVVLRGSTQNYVPRYDSGGNLVDSGIIEVGGKVGIGTATPATTFDVQATDSSIRLAGGGSSLRFQPSIVSGRSISGMTELGGIIFKSSANESLGLASIEWYADGVGTTTDSQLVLGVRDNGTSRSLTLDGSVSDGKMTWPGAVGIGTTSPTSKLHVNGDVRVDGNIAAKYQDVAEWVDAPEALPSGTVLAVGINANSVQQSRQAYDTAVAGVVSAQPGILLGERRAGRLLAAQSGRVRVKVDATAGAVAAGDLLVTSDRAGYAMKSHPIEVNGVPIHRPGTILGKALESLPGGTGEILVLLTLQ